MLVTVYERTPCRLRRVYRPRAACHLRYSPRGTSESWNAGTGGSGERARECAIGAHDQIVPDDHPGPPNLICKLSRCPALRNSGAAAVPGRLRQSQLAVFEREVGVGSSMQRADLQRARSIGFYSAATGISDGDLMHACRFRPRPSLCVLHLHIANSTLVLKKMPDKFNIIRYTSFYGTMLHGGP